MLIYSDAKIGRREIHIESLGKSIPLTGDMAYAIFRQIVMYFMIGTVFWTRVLTFNRTPITIGFYPARPKPWYKLWNITKFMGMKYSDDFNTCDVLFYFEDVTVAPVNEDLVERSNKKVMNGTCTDISKQKVQAVFKDVFGYDLGVDPTTYVGQVVAKSNDNAHHDGEIITCPIDKAVPGRAYQKFIENCFDGETVEDIRVPIIGDEIPFVYLKRRPRRIRFANDNTEAVMVETIEALSEIEVRRLIAFSRAMGLDYGGLDVLRDLNDGRIYVVDVNKTDMGPPVPLKTWKKMEALGRLGRALTDTIKSYAA